MSLLVSNRSYRLLFAASTVSNLGDGVSALALPWLATLITRDPALISLVTFAARLPWFLFAIPAGVIVDRADRRRLIVRADILRMLLTCGVVALILSAPGLPLEGGGLGYILALSALSFLLGTAEVLGDNAAQTILPAIVARDQLEAANGQMWTVEQVMGSFVGPPLAGVLIALAVPAPFLLDAATFGFAAWMVWSMSVPLRPRVAPRRMLAEIVEGWSWMRGHPTILRLAVMLGLINALATMAVTILILVSQEILGLGAFGYGLLMTAGAAGGVVGGVLGPPLIARMGGQWGVQAALLMFPVPFLVIGLTSDPRLAAAALFVETLSGMIWNIVTVSFRQRNIPDELLGRVNSLYRFFGWGMMPIGALAGGWIVSLAEPSLGRELALRLPYLAGAGGSLALCLYGSLRLRL